MVLCGSVGLHHVLGSLHQQGYKNQPVNDMMFVELPPFTLPVAAELAALLLTGEGLKFEPSAPKMIAEQTGGFPYYIHWVVSELRNVSGVVTPAEIEGAVKKLLTAPNDPCHFRYYKDRIGSYYPNEGEIVLALLDRAAKDGGPLDQASLIGAAKSAGATSENRVRELLRLLALDHYLDRDTDGRYRFRHALVRRWWVIEQALH